MRQPFRCSALYLALAAASTFALGLPVAVAGDVAHEAVRRYQIAPGPLSQAITRFADQAGLRLIVTSELLAGRRSAGLDGEFVVEQGLQQLLQGSGLAASISGDSLSLAALQDDQVAAINLGATTVNAQALTQSTEHTHAYNSGVTAVGSKVATSVREVPHSVSVITRKQIEDQNLNSLTDVMSKMTGVSLQKGGISQASMGNESNFFSRGFAVSNTQIDGGAPLTTSIAGYGSLSQLDMAQYDHVEFLRGVDGLFSSTGDPGGTINLVRKRALHDNQVRFAASAGSWDNYRSEFDVTGPLVDSAAIRGRLGMAYQDSKAFYDYGDTQNSLTYGSLEFDLSPDTTLTLGGSYQDNDGVPNFSGLPRYTSGADLKLPRRTAFTSNWNTVREKTTQAYVKVEQSFTPDWSLTTDVSYVDIDRDSSGLYYFGGVDPDTGDGPAWYNYPNTGGSVRKSFNSYVKGSFDAFDRRHDVLGGVDYTHSVGSVIQRTGYIANIPLDLGGRTPPADQGSYLTKNQYLPEIRKSLYGMLRLALTDEMKVIVGGRVADFTYQNNQAFFTGAGGRSRSGTQRESGEFTPYAGLTYDLGEQWTAYTSYAETFTPQSGSTKGPSNAPLDPSTSKNYEIGLKGQLLEGRVNTLFAVYRIEQEGAAIEDPLYKDQPIATGSCCFTNQGLVISQGFDAEVSGEVAPGLQLMAGYTYNHAIDKQSDASRTTFEGVTPKHLFKVWGTYQLPGALQDWTLGAGATSQSRTSKSGDAATYNPDSGKFDGEYLPYKFMQAGYTIWSGSLAYKVDEHWTATVNANNLFDKRYYATVGNSMYNNFYGDPRNFMLTLRGTF
ncbi:TonB-dependent siderophore receptor [Pseudomonas sp. MAFF212428]|uniref:TonB-dependent siderophore receptor n=1 Tax=Pseudomonas brassicae TaxID=2708063 RepID=A0A6B3NTP5_9PSED|nr:TonB-dependent receptor [Pseudomonas brassicae]NER59945.1 TonB-dependent siderophore receptor [Pseudomonas brassicae]NER65306.1 TonB-dependent siderophore receptor [Pseudomonas brassicae]